MRRIGASIAFVSALLCSGVVSASTPTVPSIKIPILVYHHIRNAQIYPKSTWSYKMSVSPKAFETQMKWLLDHNYTTINLDTAASILKGEIQGPTKPVVITFDDNNLNAYQNGLPVLEKNHQTATFYIITNRLQNKTTIDADRVKILVQKGMDIESHTVTHSTMTALSLKKLDAELMNSKSTLEALTGKPVKHLAYPNTTQNKTVREHAKAAGYVTATIMDPRNATQKDDLLKLPRIMMTDDSNLKKVLP